MRLFRFRFVLLLSLMLTAGIAAAQPAASNAASGNIIVNSSFENGISPWTVQETNGKDKVKCAGVAAEGACAFYFKGKNLAEATLLKQVVKIPAAGTSSTPVSIYGSYRLKGMSGSSCLRVALIVVFRSGDPKIKQEFNVCNQRVPMEWIQGNIPAFPALYPENAIKKVVFSALHTGSGEWYLDDVRVLFGGA